MAYVAISIGLRDRVRSIMNNMQEAEIKALGEAPRVIIDQHSSWFIDRVWGPHIHLKDVIPTEWKSGDRYSTYLQIFGDDGLFDVRFEYRGDNIETVYPPKWSASQNPDIDVRDADVPKEVRELYDYRLLKAEVEKRWEAVKPQVMDFLNSCKSLNEAIKLWPDLEHYIPKEYMTRMLAKNERTKSESRAVEILNGIDTQGVMAAAVMARMASAAA